MSLRRVTIMVDVNIDKKIRVLQANLIKKSTSSVSFSSVVNQLLDEALKNKK